MKRIITSALISMCIICLSGCSDVNNTDTISFHDKTFSKSDLSAETLEWLEWYNELSETEQLSISYIPSDLHRLCGYEAAEDIVAETE